MNIDITSKIEKPFSKTQKLNIGILDQKKSPTDFRNFILSNEMKNKKLNTFEGIMVQVITDETNDKKRASFGVTNFNIIQEKEILNADKESKKNFSETITQILTDNEEFTNKIFDKIAEI